MVINVVKAIHPAFAVGYIIEVENKSVFPVSDVAGLVPQVAMQEQTEE